jgi:tetratricopeptide (TPR) repeat protein
MGNLEAALADCNQAVKFGPELHFAYGSRGETYLNMGRYEDALHEFMRSNDFQPDHAFALAGQAVCYFRLGQTDKAKMMWQKLIDTDARYQQADILMGEYHCTPALLDGAREVVGMSG